MYNVRNLIAATFVLTSLLLEGNCKNSTSKRLRILDTRRYLNLSEQYKFLNDLHDLAPKSFNLEILGDTFIEGKDYKNDIYIAKFGKASAPVVLFECGLHAREWISSAACLYLIQKLTQKFSAKKKKEKKGAVLNYQWHILPMMNPDGYNISHVGERMYRKNGRPVSTMNVSREHMAACRCDEKPNDCRGVDLNRNFPTGWGQGNERFQRESSLPCFEFYKGSHPLSEPETKIIDQHISSQGEQVIGAFSIHSYGREIYHPKNYLSESDEDQVRGEELKHLLDFAAAFNKNPKFGIGSAASLLGSADLEGGLVDDFYYTTKNINISYTIELDPHVESPIGFELPASQIHAVGKYLWNVVRKIAKQFDVLYPK